MVGYCNVFNLYHSANGNIIEYIEITRDYLLIQNVCEFEQLVNNTRITRVTGSCILLKKYFEPSITSFPLRSAVKMNKMFPINVIDL